MEMSRLANNVWIVSHVTRMFISVEDGLFWTYVLDGRRYMKDCYAGRLLNIYHIDLLSVLIERYKPYDEVKFG